MDVVLVLLIVGFFAAIGGARAFLRHAAAEGEPAMNWVYWLSGAAALVILVYLVVALFKPEYFE